jgi:hypothetical protein
MDEVTPIACGRLDAFLGKASVLASQAASGRILPIADRLSVWKVR